MQRDRLATYLDATLLQPEATAQDVQQLVLDAHALGCYAVCVSPNMVPAALAALRELAAPRPLLAAVVGFPSGKHSAAIKAAEAQEVARLGVHEIDMVIDLGLALSGDFAALAAEIRAVRLAAPAPVVLKVILETAALDDATTVAACRAAEAAGADFVKTSTGFHPAGGASVNAVRLLAQTVDGRLGVKASGGIRDQQTALAMIAAGATRLGVSAAASVLSTTADTQVR